MNSNNELRLLAKKLLPTISYIVKINGCVISAYDEQSPHQSTIEKFAQYGISEQDLKTFIWWLDLKDADIVSKYKDTSMYDDTCDHFTNIVELKTGIVFHITITTNSCSVSIYTTPLK